MLTLVIGGSGSGKSAWAENYAASLPGKKLYLATMEARDEESLRRVARHRAQRQGLGFETLERPCGLSDLPLPENASLLLEDLSNLLANEMFSPAGGGVEGARAGLLYLAEKSKNLVVVTNEVFSGGDDYEALTLEYLKNLAHLNRELAARADCVAELVCGLPLFLKGKI